MLLIAEIVLTIFVWRKGWRWFSLLPLVVCIIVGLLAGLAIGAGGGSSDSARVLGIILDVIAIIVLIVMVSIEPKKTTEMIKTNEINDFSKNV